MKYRIKLLSLLIIGGLCYSQLAASTKIKNASGKDFEFHSKLANGGWGSWKHLKNGDTFQPNTGGKQIVLIAVKLSDKDNEVHTDVSKVSIDGKIVTIGEDLQGTVS